MSALKQKINPFLAAALILAAVLITVLLIVDSWQEPPRLDGEAGLIQEK